METIQELLVSFSNLQLVNHGNNTQMTSSEHEKRCSEILREGFQADTLDKKKFRSFVMDNGYQVCSHSEDSLNRSCVPSIPIINNSLNLTTNINYIIDQPSGSQNYPDIMLIRLDEQNNLHLAYIECKQSIPKFNNNPPKMNINCIYICGKDLYNGFLLTTQEWQDRKNEYIEKYYALVQEFTTDDMLIVPYKVIELNWIQGMGPQCFIDRSEQNVPLITECFSRFLN